VCTHPQQNVRLNDELRDQKGTKVVYIHVYIEAEVNGSVLTLLHA
jgi:hypothetical protein